MYIYIILVNNMANLVYYEIKKILNNKVLCLVLLICIFINGMLTEYKVQTTNENGYNMIEMANKYHEFDDINLSKSYVEKEIDALLQDDSIVTLTEDEAKNYRMLEEIYNQCVRLEDYPEYLENISKQAEKRLRSSLFSKPGTFSYRNLKQTVKVYDNMNNIKNIKPDFDDGIFLITKNVQTDFFLLIILSIIVMQIFISERENGILPIIKCMKLGHMNLLGAKYLTVILTTLFTIICFYGINLFIVLSSVGFGDVTRAIQSLNGYVSSTFLFTVGQFIPIFLFSKFIAVLAVESLFIIFCIAIGNSVFTGMAGILIYAIESFLAHKISDYSFLAILGQLNIASIINTEKYFTDYTNINIFSYPFSINICGFITAFSCIIIGTKIAFFLYEQENTVSVRRYKLKSVIKIFQHPAAESNTKGKRQYKCKGLLFYEIYKVFVVNKGALILVIFLCVQILVLSNNPYFIDSNEFYYREYSEQLYGKVSTEKTNFIQKEEQYFASLDDERELLQHRYANGEIDETEISFFLQRLEVNPARVNSFQKAQKQYNKLVQYENAGTDVEYIYQTPWILLFGEDGIRKAIISLGEAFIILILIFSSCGSTEKEGIQLIIHASSVGKKGVMIKKICICIVTSIITTGIAFSPEFINIIKTYGLNGLYASSSSFLLSAGNVMKCNMAVYLISRIVLRILIVTLAGLIILEISQKTKNRILTILLGLILLIIPVLCISLTF